MTPRSWSNFFSLFVPIINLNLYSSVCTRQYIVNFPIFCSSWMSHTPFLFFMLVDSSLFKVLHQGLSVCFKSTFDSFDSLITTIPNLVTCNRYQSFIVRYQYDTTLELFESLKWNLIWSSQVEGVWTVHVGTIWKDHG